ncbi:MAG: glycosyltransferase family 4 protein [Geminicoccaceae bacterium]
MAVIGNAGRKIRVVHLIRDLRIGEAQLRLLHFLEQSCPETEASLMPLGPRFDSELSSRLAGLDVTRIEPLTPPFCYSPWHLGRRLRSLAPDIVHAHGPIARATGLFIVDRSCSMIVNTPLTDKPWRQPFGWMRTTSKRIRTVSSGVEMSGLDPRRANPRTILMLRGYASPVVGTIAPLNAGQGLDRLIAMMATLRHVAPLARLLLIGSGPLLERLEDQAEDLDIGDAVTIEPAPIDRTTALAALDVFVLPASRTVSLTPLVQAMVAGVPVVAHRTPGTQEIIRNQRNGVLVDADDPSGLAGAVIDLLKDSDRRRRMVVDARRTVKSRFSADEAGERALDLYRELAASP